MIGGRLRYSRELHSDIDYPSGKSHEAVRSVLAPDEDTRARGYYRTL